MTNCATLHDLAARFGTGNEAELYRTIVELQSKTNKILQVLPFKAANAGLVEKAVVRADLPDVAWRLINKGVTPGKSASKQVSFGCGTLEALAEIDEELVELNKHSAEWRLSENQAYQEAMNQKMATTIFYGDEKVNPAGFTGLNAYYYSTKLDKSYADQIVDAGGTGNALTSVWFMCMGQNTVYGIFPEMTHAGFEYRDNGRVQVHDAAGGKYWAYQSQYKWRMGLALKDPRYVSRLANVDMTKLTEDNAQDFMMKMVEAFNRIENPDMGTMAIFCNRDVESYIDKCAMLNKNTRLTIDDFGGHKITHFRGVPILRSDAVLSTESQIQ